jgi:TRAP-type C4-dicarboxylate transport system substrate-binding protein
VSRHGSLKQKKDMDIIRGIFRREVLTLGMAFVFLGSVFAFAEEGEVLLKMGMILPQGTPAANLILELKQEILKKTQGRIKTEWYMGAVLGDETDMRRKAMLDQIQGGAWTVGGLSPIVSETQLLEGPFFFNFTLSDYREVDCVLQESYPIWQEMFEEKGFVLVDWYQQGPIYFIHKSPANTMEDAEKFKAWSYPGYPMSEEIMQAWGVKNRISLGLPEVLTGLQTGIIETAYASPASLVGLQWYTEVNYILGIPVTFSPVGVLVTRKAFDRLSPSDQKIFLETFRSKTSQVTQSLREADRLAYQGLVEGEGAPLRVSGNPEIFAELKKRGGKVYENLTGRVWSQDFYQQIVSIRNQCRASLQ